MGVVQSRPTSVVAPAHVAQGENCRSRAHESDRQELQGAEAVQGHPIDNAHDRLARGHLQGRVHRQPQDGDRAQNRHNPGGMSAPRQRHGDGQGQQRDGKDDEQTHGLDSSFSNVRVPTSVVPMCS